MREKIQSLEFFADVHSWVITGDIGSSSTAIRYNRQTSAQSGPATVPHYLVAHRIYRLFNLSIVMSFTTLAVLSVSLLLPPLAIAQSAPAAGPGRALLERAVDPQRVVPVIRGQREIDALDPATREALAVRQFAGVLYVVLAEDTGDTIRYLTNEEVSKLNWPTDEVKTNALVNMAKLLPRFEIRGSKGFFMIIAGGNYESSMLLATPLWEKLRTQLKGEPVVGIPNRDLFFITGSQDKENLAALRQMVNDAYANGKFPVSNELFLVGQQRLSLFKEVR